MNCSNSWANVSRGSVNKWMSCALLLGTFLACRAAAADTASQGSSSVGQYLATAANCAACHTAPGGRTFAGGVTFETPFGTIYSTNITPDPDTGIGRWSEQQFASALRHGVRPDGTHLYPAFPYTSFTKITDGDTAALYKYLMSLPSVKSRAPATNLSFPYNQRWLMGPWNSLYFDDGPYKPNATKSQEWNRGAYLVEGLAHCSACHSPRNFLGAEKASLLMTGGVYTDKVAAGRSRNWSTPNLTSAPTGLGTWSVDDLAAYLKTGRNSFTTTFGPMNDVIVKSTSHLTDADVHAMATYIKSIAPNRGESGSKASDETVNEGSSLYDVHCGTCHEPTGLGSEDTGPKLDGAPVLQASDPASLINVILYGPEIPNPAPPARWKHMEGFADKLSDAEIATLTSFLRSAWSNKAGSVSEAQVAKQR